MSYSQEQKRIAKLLGINKLNSDNDIRQINEAKNAARALGIRNLDSENDVKKIRAYLDSKNTNSPNNNNNPPVNIEPEKIPPGYQTKVDDLTTRIDEMTKSIQDREKAFDERFNIQKSSFEKLMSEERSVFESKFSKQQADYQNEMNTMQSTLMAQMNPASRNPVLGVRFAGNNNNLNRKGINTTFGRSGSRIQGIKNTSLNVT